MHNLAYRNSINVVNAAFSSTKKASCMRLDKDYIILDKKACARESEELCILGEEMGHYLTNSLYEISGYYNSSIERSNRLKCEYKAKSWAYKSCISISEIKEGIKQGCRNDFELAEFCEVEVNFLLEAIEYYKTKGVDFNTYDS